MFLVLSTAQVTTNNTNHQLQIFCEKRGRLERRDRDNNLTQGKEHYRQLFRSVPLLFSNLIGSLTVFYSASRQWHGSRVRVRVVPFGTRDPHVTHHPNRGVNFTRRFGQLLPINQHHPSTTPPLFDNPTSRCDTSTRQRQPTTTLRQSHHPSAIPPGHVMTRRRPSPM
jgi:hypothetical protein